MAADVEMLDAVAGGGGPILRLYTWSRPALSIGRLQADGDVDRDACGHHGVEVVRRPTGGRALLHGADVTYSIALPEPRGAAGRVDAVHATIAAGLIAGLADLGVPARLAHGQAPDGAVCFTGGQGADLRVGERKLCGSAQCRHRGAVLQHGSVLLDRLPFAETDLVRGGRRPGEHADAARARLAAASVTLRELGAPTAPAVVAAALAAGLARTLDLDLRSRVDA